MRIAAPTRIVYPESDGLPMAENTRQAEWMSTIYGNLTAQYRKRDDVFVALDLYWYPVEGHPEIRTAPDVFVVFGRPNEHRTSYRQWEENGVAPQVTFEILSPSNRGAEMARKFKFYTDYGVDEYYTYDPDYGFLVGWVRQGANLIEVARMNGFTSPHLGIRFEIDGLDLTIIGADGEPFVTFAEIVEQKVAETERAQQERLARQQAQTRADKLAAKLREMGMDPNTI